MSRKTDFIKVLKRYGSDISYRLLDKNGTYTEAVSTKAFIQPLRYKNKMYIGNSYLQPGELDGGHYLYMGDPSLRFDNCTASVILSMNGDEFYIKRAEPFVFNDEVIYIWAILAKHTPIQDQEVTAYE